MKRHFSLKGWTIVAVLMIFGLVITACDLTGTDTTASEGIQTWLLVTPPESPLPANRPLNVRSRTQDPENFVSHVELYAVQLPSGDTDVLIRSDAAPFQQTTFTASQVFIPRQPGHYVIKVVGYNKLGNKAESDFIGFDVQ